MVQFILSGAFILGLCIFIHELGHYLMGRLVGIKAEIFSIGYGRGIWKKKIGDTTWQITAIPLGGYVKFYGDDFTDPESSKHPGGLLNAPPLRRIVPVLGGPLFNLILGFIVFVLIHSVYGPLSPEVNLNEANKENSPAYKAGIRDGDKILAVDGNPVRGFLDIRKHISLSGGRPVQVEVERAGQTLDLKVQPELDPSGLALIGIRNPGPRYVEVTYHSRDKWSYYFDSIFSETRPPESLRALTYLKDGDVLLALNGKEVHTVADLQKVLGEYHGQSIKVKVRRQTMAWLTPMITRDMVVDVPSRPEYKLVLTNITDLKYNARLPDQTLISLAATHEKGLAELKINGKSAGSFKELHRNFNTPTRKARVELGALRYQADVVAQKIGSFGFRPTTLIESKHTNKPDSFGGVISDSLGDTWNNIAIYPVFFQKLFSGRMSFSESAIGPVGMFAVAGRIAKEGLYSYLQLLAIISIALMVMNLLPFPVVDGGHIAFFLYEAIAGKPIAPRVMESMYRFGFSVLMFLGLWIMYQDIIRFVL